MKSVHGYMHGINLGGWFSQCEHTSEHYDTFICRDDIRRISEWGFDHLRLPVDYAAFRSIMILSKMPEAAISRTVLTGYSRS